MNAYLRHFLASTVYNLARPANGSRRLAMMGKQLLPYAAFPRGNGEYILVNREYKPLGWPPTRRAFIDYQKTLFNALSIPANEITGGERGEAIMLYSPLNAPWSSVDAALDYQARIAEIFGPMEFTEAGDTGANDDETLGLGGAL